MRLVSWFPWAFVNRDAAPDLLLLRRDSPDVFHAYIVWMVTARRN